jgi:hypothetical protein
VQKEGQAIAEPEKKEHEEGIEQEIVRGALDHLGDKLRNIKVPGQMDAEAHPGNGYQNREVKEKEEAVRGGQFSERAKTVGKRGAKARALAF